MKQTNTLIILTLMGAFVAFLLIDYLLIFGRADKIDREPAGRDENHRLRQSRLHYQSEKR